jgi:hypothetical protein
MMFQNFVISVFSVAKDLSGLRGYFLSRTNPSGGTVRVSD